MPETTQQDLLQADGRWARRVAGLFLLVPCLLKLVEVRVAGYYTGSQLAALRSVLLAGVVLGTVLLLSRRAMSSREAGFLAAVGLLIVGTATAVAGSASGRSLSATLAFVVVFVFLGLTQRVGVVVSFAPVLAMAHVLPYAPDPEAMWRAVTSGLLVVPTATLVGAVLARAFHRLRCAQAIIDERARRLRLLAEAPARIAQAEDAAFSLATVARDVADADAVWVVSARTRGREVIGWIVPAGGDPSAGRYGRRLVERAEATGTLQQEVDGHHLYLAAPLEDADRRVAVLLVRTPLQDASDETEAHVRLFAQEMGVALSRRIRHDELTLEATRDPLTGVGNRGHVTDLLQSLTARDAVAFIDLDHFKQVNDRHGHAAGDRVLAALADYLSSELRGLDTVGRYGGEEFMVVLRDVRDPGSGADQTDVVASRLHAGWQDPTGYDVTFSMGVARHDADGDPNETLAAADAALYEAKRAGRNRTIVAPYGVPIA